MPNEKQVTDSLVAYPYIRLSGILFFLLFGLSANAQTSFCGSIGPFQAPTNNPDSIVYDRFGNTYLIGSIMGNSNNTVGSRSSVAGYFELQVGKKIPSAAEEVIQNVLNDISTLITRRELTDNCGDPVPQPNIYIVVDTLENNNGATLAAATPLYKVLRDNCPDNTSSGVQQSNIMRKLNGEPLRSSVDGKLFINISPPNPYYYGADVNGIAANQYDFYSIILHEVMHLIGYSGTTESDGQPIDSIGSYSEWDRLLYTTPAYDSTGNSPNTAPLLTSNCTDNCYQINSNTFSDTSAFQNAIEQTCNNNTVDIVVGNTGTAPILGGNGGSFPNLISHLDPDCGNRNYVMQPSLSTGTIRRDLTTPEIDILCELGYETTECGNPCFMTVASQDIFSGMPQNDCCYFSYTTCPGEPLLIPIAELLCNDHTNGESLTLTRVFTAFSMSTYEVNIVGDYIEFRSDDQAYYSNIGYTVESCDCKLLNGQFAVNVIPCDIPCETDNACEEAICINGFEDFKVTGKGAEGAGNQFLPGPPFWINSTTNNTPDILTYTSINNTYIHCGSFREDNGGVEGFAINLNSPVYPGCSLFISLDLAQAGGEYDDRGSLIIKGSSQYPCTTGSLIGADSCGSSNCGGIIQDYACISTIRTKAMNSSKDSANSWETERITWVNNETYPINTLVFHPKPLAFGIPENGLLIDNITGSISCANNLSVKHQFHPEAACIGEDLEIQYRICADSSASQIEFNYNVVLPNGVDLVDGNSTGTLNIPGGFCEVIQMTVAVNNGATPGDSLDFILNYSGPNICGSYPLEVPTNRLPDPDFDYFHYCGTVNFNPFDTHPANTHYWDFGDGQSSNDMQPIHSYDGKGLFNVQHIVSNACGSTSTTQQIVVIENEAPNPDFSFNAQVCSTLVNFTSSSNNVDLHEWDLDGDPSTIESTDPNPIFDFQTPGIYPVTHFTTNSCDITSSTQEVIIEECSNLPCDCPMLIEGGSGILLSEISLPPNEYNNVGSCLSISGALIIDTLYRILGGEIQMQPGSRIVINNFAKLDLVGVDLYGCDQMWEGITVQGFGNLTMRNSSIQDAHWAITANNFSNLSIGKSVFNNNYIGIYTAPTANGSGQYINARIANNSFTSTAALRPRYPNQPLTQSNRSRSGVELYNTQSMVIGGLIERPLSNSFSDLNYGVYAKDCANLLIQRAQMNNLIEASTGIYLDNSIIVAINQVELSNLKYGINGFRSSPILRESNIDSHKEGVFLEFGQGRSAQILQTSITSPHSCIFISDYTGSGEVKIEGCSLSKEDNSDAAEAAAIYVNRCMARLIIADNPSIAFSSRGFGIRIANSMGQITIENNPLIYSTGNNWANTGIDFENVSGAQVYNNIINNSGNHAIKVADSRNNLYCCNQVNQARDGIFFQGNCTGTRLKNTEFGQHTYGLNLSDAVISLQNFHGNSWVSANCEEYDAVFSSNTSASIFQSPFITNISYLPRRHDFIAVFGGGTPPEWFIFEDEFDPHCTYYCDEPPYLIPPPVSPPCTHIVFGDELTEIDHWAAADLSENDELNKGTHNREQHYLLQKLDCQPSLLGQDTEIDLFYQNAQTSSLGAHHQQRQALQSLFLLIENEELVLLYTEQKNLIDQINQLDSIGLIEEGSYFAEQINEIMRTIDQQEKENWIQVKNDAEVLFESNQTLSEAEIFENNEKAINQILLTRILQSHSDFEEEEQNIIDAIAEQCPLSGGLAVHQARGLQAFYRPQCYDDQELCQTAGERNQKEKQLEKQNLIQVFPNPANHFIHFQIEEHYKDNLLIEFYTIEGKEFRKFKTKSSFDLNIGAWPAGVYVYKISNNKESTLTQNRLIIYKNN